MGNTWCCRPVSFTFATSGPRTDTRPTSAVPSIDSPEKQDCLPPRDVSSSPDELAKWNHLNFRGQSYAILRDFPNVTLEK
ncbi:hypothetical protein K0M31_004759 [Melipona bicolor]|uniref:Uncharacterized protein n=1 Tax=Melipona bicolor TaxID=60889 RepID=A0AA40FVR4_9HYME|nr:hypothetical protein K0M31_004759 [Melipona bicolor]